MLSRRSDVIAILAGLVSLWAAGWVTSFLPVHGGSPSFKTVGLTAPPLKLNEQDEVAALEILQYALSEVGDGKTYVWRRWHGRLSGIVQPTASFKDAGGKVCRHLLVLMTAGWTVKTQQGIACRLPTGRWQLGG